MGEQECAWRYLFVILETMKQNRLFIAVQLPETFRNWFEGFRSRWQDFPVKWTDVEHVHLTLSFLGNVPVEHLPDLISALEEVGERHLPFSLVFTSVEYGPDQRRPRMNTPTKGRGPRLIWARAEESAKFSRLYADIRRELSMLPFPLHENRPKGEPHVTVARFNSLLLREWREDTLPEISEALSIPVSIDTFHLFESKLRRSGAEHFVLQSFMLNGK